MVTLQSVQGHTGLIHPFLSFFLNSGTLALRTDRQSARMSKKTGKSELDQYGPERFGRLILPQLEKRGNERVNWMCGSLR